jgi:protein-S-isoprenylcysteine O-methyltransferase Ste14
VSAAFAILTVGRAVPRRPSRSPIAFVACVVAMGTVVAFGDPPLHASNGTVLVGDLLAVLACGWMLTSVLFLGRCFGVLPEARGLVTQGPYGVVRHPVYLGEIGACVGLAIAASTARNAVLLAAFVAAQAIRMRLEERALREAFPEYEAYARKVPRVVPMLRWRAAARDAALAPNRP